MCASQISDMDLGTEFSVFQEIKLPISDDLLEKVNEQFDRQDAYDFNSFVCSLIWEGIKVVRDKDTEEDV